MNLEKEIKEQLDILVTPAPLVRTRCKFKCVDTGENYDTFWARFEPVMEGSEENKQFFKYTPGGQLHLHVINKQYFEQGKEYYLDITEVA